MCGNRWPVITDRTASAMASCVASDDEVGLLAPSCQRGHHDGQTSDGLNEPFPLKKQPVCPRRLATAPFRPKHASIPSRRRWIAIALDLAVTSTGTQWLPSGIHRIHLVATWPSANSGIHTKSAWSPLGLRRPLGPVWGLSDFLYHRLRLVATWPEETSWGLPNLFCHRGRHLVLLIEGFDFAAQWVANLRNPTLPRNMGWRRCFTMP